MTKLEQAPLTNVTFACDLRTVAQFDPSFWVNVAAAGGVHRGGRGGGGAQRAARVCSVLGAGGGACKLRCASRRQAT